jgi:broad specificity phosphatase PhoE
MPQLVLIKHSKVTQDPAVPPKHWPLSDEGRSLCRPLADALKMHKLDLLISSEEPKAIETTELVAARLRIETETAPDLDEHRRPFVAAGFEDTMKRFFAQPTDRIFGEESANEARARFAEAINAVLRAHPDRTLGIVTHGTVIALYAAPYFHTGAAALWQRLQHPSFVVIDTDTGAALRIVDEVE